MKVIELIDLTKLYDSKHGVHNIDVTVHSGEIFGFVGPNGAGKSTTIKTMLGLLRANSGQVKIFGKNFTKHREAILAKTGYVSSEINFYDEMSAIDLFRFTASFYNSHCEAECKRLVELFQIDKKKKIKEMSIGNKKKVAIVNALQHKPDLLILDEPTSGLDPLMQKRFYTELESIRRRGGTVFLSSHVLSEVERLCDRVAVIRNGEVVITTTLEAIREHNFLQVKIETVETIDFEGLHIDNLEFNEHTTSFLYKGNIPFLLERLSHYSISSISILEPDLETMFMQYYGL